MPFKKQCNVDKNKTTSLCLVYMYDDKFYDKDIVETIKQYSDLGVSIKQISNNSKHKITKILPAILFNKNNKLIYTYYGNSVHYLSIKIKQYLFNISI